MSDQKISTRHPGTIKLSSKVVITDPCYDVNTWCNITKDDVLSGEYEIFVRIGRSKRDCYNGVSRIILIHKDYLHYFINDKIDLINDKNSKALFKTELVHRYHKTPIGVDSGLAGFFDYNYFTAVKNRTPIKYDRWFDKVCNKINNRFYTKIDAKGFFSTNWFGDGGYNLFTFVDKADTDDEFTVGFVLDYRLEDF